MSGETLDYHHDKHHKTEALTREATAHFGSDWAWLVQVDGVLRVISLHDGDAPALHEGLAQKLGLRVGQSRW